MDEKKKNTFDIHHHHTAVTTYPNGLLHINHAP